MINFNQVPVSVQIIHETTIPNFINSNEKNNIDWETVNSFGEEWKKFASFSKEEITKIGNDYFDIALDKLSKESLVLEVGCGSGRWMKFISGYVKEIHGIDPSASVESASLLLREVENKMISRAEVDNIPYEDQSFDMVYSLGVLHHIPDTQSAMLQSVKKIKLGGYFLVYLYYSLDNRGIIFKVIFHLSNLLRWFISKLPSAIKKIVCDFLAVFLYLPFVGVSCLLDNSVTRKWLRFIPLSYYRDKTFKIIRNDSLDRFGTPLEQRFSKRKISEMMSQCGLNEIKFSEKEPYWHAIGKRVR